MNVLFISYDGLLSPIGQSQVREYLRGLAVGHRVVLVSFEKAADLANPARMQRMMHDVEGENIRWIPLRQHERPALAAAAVDVAAGVALCSAIVVARRIDVVHAHGFVASNIALTLKKALGVPFIFDMRGFWVDEKAEAGVISEGGAAYKLGKRLEGRFLREASAVVSLTHAAVKVIKDLPVLRGAKQRFAVIPACTNLEAFSTGKKPSTPGSRDFVLGYVGAVESVASFDDVALCFKALLELKPSARLLVIDRGGREFAARSLEQNGVSGDRVEIRSAAHAEAPAEFRKMDAGVFFARPGYSRSGAAPTTLGEFLASGVPCLTNRGVGDVDTLLEPKRVGVVLKESTDLARRTALQSLIALADDPDVQARCRAAAKETFSLYDGVRAIDALYRDVRASAAP